MTKNGICDQSIWIVEIEILKILNWNYKMKPKLEKYNNE